jgi:phenylacetate-CoA ligase
MTTTADDRSLTDSERFPLIDAAGLRHLEQLRQHPHAPRYNFRCGDRLTAVGRDRVRAFEKRIFESDGHWAAGEVPQWVRDHAERCSHTVPFYRKRPRVPFEQMAPVSRADLQREPWAFVPDDQPLEGLINYWTSGASGHSMDVLSHPEVASMRLPIFRKALARHGLTLDGGSGRTAVLFVCSQSTTFTYASLSSYLEGAAHVKINLHAREWRTPDDRVAFIDALQPEILTGDPLSFLDLASLPVTVRPKALISSAMALLPGTRRKLEERFSCPVIDLYSTCETGPIALAAEDGFDLFLPDVYIEILRADGRRAAPGERGEIAFTGGRNPFLPLVRYRTGDWAALSYGLGRPRLTGFEGRAPVVFRAADGRLINNIEITIAFRPFPVAQFHVHQNSDGSLLVRTAGEAPRGLEESLRIVFGAGQRMTLEPLDDPSVKQIPFTSDLPAYLS